MKELKYKFGDITKSIFKHILFHREVYIHPIVGFLLIVLTIHGVGFLTGRSIVDDVGAWVGGTINLGLIIITCIGAGFIRDHFFTDLTDEEFKAASFREKILDICVSIFCLSFVAYLIFH